MEAIRSSETSGTTQRTTRRHIPEEDTLQYQDGYEFLIYIRLEGLRKIMTIISEISISGTEYLRVGYEFTDTRFERTSRLID
jgi:hypothetical protein